MFTRSLCLIQRVLYEPLIGFMFVVLFLSVLLIASCGRLSWPALWTTFGRTMKWRLIVWLTDRSISKSFFVITASSCMLSTCSMSARHQCEANTWRHDAHFATVVRGCCHGCRSRFRRPWSWRCWYRRLPILVFVLVADAVAAVVDPRL